MGKNGAEVLHVNFANRTYQRKSKVNGNFGWNNAIESCSLNKEV